MKLSKTILSFGLAVVLTTLFAQEKRDINYIKSHAKIAVQEMHLYKIPASITLSQGILETGGGQSRLAEKANNHFGIKCKKEWTGEKIYHDDDAKGECFRKYPSVFDSYRDHSKFLAERPYYKSCFKIKNTDYKNWSRCLKRSGYATNPKYAEILINRIEKYKLHEFDLLQPQEVDNKLATLFGLDENQITKPIVKNEKPVAVVSKPIAKNQVKPKKENADKKIEINQRDRNPQQRIKTHPVGKKYIVLRNGETLQKIAKIYNIRTSKLLKYNDVSLENKPNIGQNVFLEKKKNKGVTTIHKVTKNETMYAIAQLHGVKLNKLYRLNRMKPGAQPKENEIIYLTKKRKKT